MINRGLLYLSIGDHSNALVDFLNAQKVTACYIIIYYLTFRPLLKILHYIKLLLTAITS